MSANRLNFFSLLLAVSSLPLLGVAAYADPSEPPHVPTSVSDYHNMINPATNISTTGPYDVEDLYRGSNGFALPGDAQIR